MQVPIATRRFVFILMDLQDLSVGLLQVPNKQWGFTEHNNIHQSTIALPIAFAYSGYVGVANDSGTITIGIKPVGNNAIELRDNNGGGKTGIYWIIIGH